MSWAAIFDVDGTMVDNRHYHEKAWLEYGTRHGLGITPEFYRGRMHSRSNAELARLLLGPDIDAAAIVALSEEKESIYRELYRPVLCEIPGLKALLSALTARGVPCAAVSNSPPGNVAMVIDELGIRDRFRLVIDYTEVSKGKPDPELFLTAAAQLGVHMECCLIFEDSVSGFAAAEAAGAPYVAVTTGADPAELKNARKAVAMVLDFTELEVEQMARWATLPC